LGRNAYVSLPSHSLPHQTMREFFY
jgi:hypothetical protein